MQTEIIRSMHEQVRAIYRALTGEDVADDAKATDEAAPETDDDITRRFAELEAMARALPAVTERVPPYTFTPPVDVIAGADAVIIELAIPGVARDDITIDHLPAALAISGIRRASHGARGNLFHAEIERGPFCRVIPLPFPIEAEPRIELEHGVLRIYLTLAAAAPPEDANGSST